MSESIDYSSVLANASSFYISTPMLRDLHQCITQWTWCGMTGGVIVGEARCGKSFAIRALSDHILSRTGQRIPIFRISYGKRDKKTIREVYSKTAKALGYKVKLRDTSEELSEMICTKLAEAAESNDTKKVILIIDETQYLTIDQLTVFAEIYNTLEEVKANCVIFFVANEDTFSPLVKKLHEKENSYIMERFFTHTHHQYGIRNSQELKLCLKEFDQYIVDIENNISATQAFCPHLYDQGWRLIDLAKPYWQHYCEGYKIPLQHKSWRMNQFIRSTNVLLMDYLPRCKNSNDHSYIEAAIVKSLEAAAITPDLVKYVS
ncbi:ATP-binding protein [Microbulbifer rhizosphaerae]|uniref:ORC1/DEAH AAA+ ATPase domain-containing protein n=1 Tax=Microbulbifer rhizosphaerae TaxID=1562603 RepID=A0A7W4Z9B6_9GAMM|nr:ATP-binding protein [Microbulbifer rhizosphaerae]MBB3060055.1 hypothetical protein [Microbulbifer rhizosphaerae]